MAKRRVFCIYCKRDLLKPDAVYPDGAGHGRAFTRDHMHPQSQGGTKWYPCCRACNQVKADMTIREWDTFRQLVPQWWRLFPKYTSRTWRGYNDACARH